MCTILLMFLSSTSYCENIENNKYFKSLEVIKESSRSTKQKNIIYKKIPYII